MTREALLWIAIVGIGLTAVVARSSFLLVGGRRRLPPTVERALRYAPAAALAGIVAPALVVGDRGLDVGLANHHWPAAIVAAVVIALGRGMLWAMAAGMATYTVLRWWY